MIDQLIDATSSSPSKKRAKIVDSSKSTADDVWRGYHKPIMIVGGVGNIREVLIEKLPVVEDAKVIVLGYSFRIIFMLIIKAFRLILVILWCFVIPVRCHTNIGRTLLLLCLVIQVSLVSNPLLILALSS